MNQQKPPLKTRIINFYQKHEYLSVGIFLFILIFLCFAPQSIRNGLTLPMHGDYILQQLHFYVEGYDSFWNFVRTGQFQMWSYEGFLGVNYFAANTFYYLTSPFLLPILFFPRTLIPQAIFIMYMIKLTTGGLLFYVLLKKYLKIKPQVAIIGAVIYSLSGWGMYYLWFNHFADVLAIFPLVLIGIEHCLQKKQGWLLSLGLLLCGMVNYYFFFAIAILSFFYAIFRYFQLFKTNKGSNLRIIVMGALAYLVGIGMCGFVLVTALNVIGSMGRIESSSLLLTLLKFFFVDPSKADLGYQLGALKSLQSFFNIDNLKGLWNYLFVFEERYIGGTITPTQTALYPLVGFLFPPINNWDTMVFANSAFDNTISNIYCSAPIILLMIPTIIKTLKEKKVWNIIGLIFMLILPFIPITYYLLNGFAMMYGRWQIFLVAIILIYTLPTLQDYKNISKLELDLSYFITLITMIGIATYAFSIEKVSFQYGRGYLIAVQMIYLTIVYFYLREQLSGPSFYKKMFYWIIIEMVCMGNITAFGQGVAEYFDLYGGRQYINEQQTIVNEIKANDQGFYRIMNVLANREYNNLPMTLGYNGLSTFHSVYNTNLNTFINDWSKVSYSYYNWSMGVDEKRANLDSFLNVKYYILNKDDNNIPWGCSLYKEYDLYKVYQNDYFVELGYAFDTLLDIKNVTQYYDYFQLEPSYARYAIIESNDMAEITTILDSDITISQSNASKDFTEIYSYDSVQLKLRGSNALTNVISVQGADSSLPENRIVDGVRYYYGQDRTNGNPGDQIIVNLNEHNLLCPTGNEDYPCHVITKLNYGPNLKVSFYHGDKLLTSDTHGVHNYDKSGDHKFARGYYISEPADKVVIEFIDDCTVDLFKNFGFGLYYENFYVYQYDQEKLMANKFDNIVTTHNTIDFETSYDKQKMIVLSVPYDEGWSLKVNGEEAKIYKVDSGFIGFIAPKGKATYSLNYFTPGLKTGIKISLLSLLLFIVINILFNLKALPKVIGQLSKKKAK